MKNKLIVKFSIILIIGILLTTYLIFNNFSNSNQSELTSIQGQQKTFNSYQVPNTAKEVVADMKLGWNLGNTLD